MSIIEIAENIYDAVGIQSPKVFILSAAIVGAILFGLFAWSISFGHQKAKQEPQIIIRGGDGGNATVVGNNSSAVGGSGGKAEIHAGGRGGDVHISGDFARGRGGDGGNSGQYDGRGGRRTSSPAELENADTSQWAYGYGGAGANHPEYDRRLRLLIAIRQEYIKAFPGDEVFIQAGIDPVPIRWVNRRLQEMNESWRVDLEHGGYKLPPLDNF